MQSLYQEGISLLHELDLLFVSRNVVFKEIEFPFAANLDTEQQWFLDITDSVQDQDVQEVQTPATAVQTLDAPDNLEPEEPISKGAGDQPEQAITSQEDTVQKVAP